MPEKNSMYIKRTSKFTELNKEKGRMKERER